MVFFRYEDVPGVIGRVGTMFGDAGVNIANMAVSRTKQGGEALMAFAIDSEPPPELVERIRASRLHGRPLHRARLIPGLEDGIACPRLEAVGRVHGDSEVTRPEGVAAAAARFPSPADLLEGVHGEPTRPLEPALVPGRSNAARSA